MRVFIALIFIWCGCCEGLKRVSERMQLAVPSSSSTSVRDRMMYWKGADSPAPPPLPVDGDRYLFLDYDTGGLNNIRISWEMAALAAYNSNRTLVYPPRQTLYLVDKEPSGLDYFVNMDRVKAGMSVLSLREFLLKEKARLPGLPEVLFDWAAKGEDEKFPRKAWSQVRKEKFTNVGSDVDQEVCNMEKYRSYLQADNLLYVDPDKSRGFFSCGNWPNVGEPKFTKGRFSKRWNAPDSSFALLRNHFVWHDDAFDIASRVVEHLGIFNYISMHARYGDFQFQANKNATHTLLSNGWLSLLQTQSTSTARMRARAGASRGKAAYGAVRHWLNDRGGSRTIYVATDETTKDYLKPFQEKNLTVVRWQELLEDAHAGKGPLKDVVKKYSPERLYNLAGIAEQLICTFGRVFIGSEKSTFSGYIERMRLYAGAPTHATYIKYAGVKPSDTGLRLFHNYPSEASVEAKIEAQLAEWDRTGGQLDRNEPGLLPRDAFY
eukprot:gnl/TRDRNA2_/TRDRNA2_185737_c0_seq1.p1 gnl/TRDRNA2_/TRDRNA2_185737_c0~~gnl/TRDRNA2_/TRDRNA2_185737_c0_seq1.p1  ORF type:complete len:492 (+),score=84.65 gnl/TRDRNA2_/TRDRNA2_185737_c0_seq1:41-1516(+)